MGRAALLTRREQALAHFAYGHEYQGNNGRLVVTPLTDRCYLAMGAALAACRVSNPLGPPGTGARARPRRERAFMAGHTLTGARPCRQDRDGEGARCARLAAQPLPQFVYTSPELIRAPSDPCPGSWQDFGKALARFVVVSHCTGGMGVEAVGRMLSGAAQTGAWACLHDGHRLPADVLSVVATQVATVMQARPAVLWHAVCAPRRRCPASSCILRRPRRR